MPDALAPVGPGPLAADTQALTWQEPRTFTPAFASSPLERPVAALRRYKWAALAVIVLAVCGGLAATRFVSPMYEVRSTILISSDSPTEERTGPIRSSGLLTADDWTQLLKSGTVTDAVVRDLRLYLQPADYARDGQLFNDFTLGEKFVPGRYELDVDRTNKRWSLLSLPSGVEVDAGAAADWVGRRLGFIWLPPASLYSSGGMRKIRFTVATPREVSAQLVSRLGAQRPPESNFLRLTLQDGDPKLAASILNTWTREYVSVAAALKKRKLVNFTSTLESQLHTAKSSLDQAEVQLSGFRTNAITEPSEGGPATTGAQSVQGPVIQNYFTKKVEYEDLEHDIALLQSALSSGRDSISNEALLQVRIISSGAALSQDLRSAMADLHTAETSLAAARVAYTDEHPNTQNLAAQVRTLRHVRIPQLARALLASLKARAADDNERIAATGQNLQRIPQRTMEEERLRRLRDMSSTLYTNLQNRFSEARLAEASLSPDVRVLDSAIAPLAPTKNTTPGILLISVVGGVAAALGLAVLLDKVDPRLRYLSQVSAELGLPVVGTVPALPKRGVDANSPEQAFQLVESFRSLRMNVMHASAGPSVSLAISSPSPGEGKSLIAANLAMSFAGAGFRTVLVDGDTRRGALQDAFAVPAAPGLTDYLARSADLDAVLRPTSDANLHLMPCGTRMKRSPELLTTARLPQLVEELRKRFDVVLFDTPPLAAGVDGYSIAASAGSLLVVLRVGRTRRRMASEKLRLVDRLPIELIGAVLNGIHSNGEYTYYSYVPGYEAHDEAELTSVARIS